ncbi:MAG: 1-acyl-sn-glycerol-3-phosphate acyltransferase [Acidobacteria bacterium]|nr:1-acyl-sn-glycerol-3-phosphate acyltransferase [Acidobacteriota bacterium]
MKTLCRIRSLMLVPIILLWTALMALLSILLSLPDRDGHLQHGCARSWARFILWVSGADVHADSLRSVSGPGPFIFVCNHQSIFDIFSVLAFLPVQFRFFAKDSLFRIPFLGWHLKRAGHLPVDRSNARAAYRSFWSAMERIQSGMSVLVFPEGSRSLAGEIGSFKKGSLRLALAAGVPVVPIAIYGSCRVLPKGSMLISPGRIDLSVGPPILPGEEDLKDKENFVEEVRGRVLEQYRKLELGDAGNFGNAICSEQANAGRETAVPDQRGT